MRFLTNIIKIVSQTITNIFVEPKYILPMHYDKKTMPLKNVIIKV